MKRSLLLVTIVFLASISGPPPVRDAAAVRVEGAPAGVPPSLAAHAAFLLDDTTGRVLYGFNADVPRYPASTVKLMTAIVALQHLSLQTVLTVPPAALVGGTTAGLHAGERLTVHDLFYGMLLPSGNDAATTLAIGTSGSTWGFAGLMNAEARRLHLWHSHFLGPQGFDLAGQYATARDLAWLAHAVLRRPFLAQIVRTRVYRASSIGGGSVHVWTNIDRLLWTYPGAIGVKTGTTSLAGANLVTCAVRGNQRIIGVILGSTVASRFSDATALLNYGWQLVGR